MKVRLQFTERMTENVNNDSSVVSHNDMKDNYGQTFRVNNHSNEDKRLTFESNYPGWSGNNRDHYQTTVPNCPYFEKDNVKTNFPRPKFSNEIC